MTALSMSELISDYHKEQTIMEMDGATFKLLDSILWEEFSMRLLVTRAFGDKLVAVIKQEQGA